MQCKCWVSQQWRVTEAEHVKLPYTCQHFAVDCWWWWLLVLKLLFHQTFKVQHHQHTTSTTSQNQLLSVRICFALLVENSISFHCSRLVIKVPLIFLHRQFLPHFKPTLTSIHKNYDSSIFVLFAHSFVRSIVCSFFIVAAASFSSVKLNWVCMAFWWKLKIWFLEQVSMTEKSVSHLFPYVAVSGWFLSSQHAYLNGISFYRIATQSHSTTLW